MRDPEPLVDKLRRRILNRVHLQGARRGDRLPAIRDLSVELQADHRAVAEAYRRLQEEGLVEIRGRSGAFLSYDPPADAKSSPGVQEWLASVLLEARQRAIPLTDLPRLLTPLVQGRPIRCACFEGSLDQLVAHSWELRTRYGLATTTVNLRDRAATRRPRLEEVVRKSDFLYTTSHWRHIVAPLAASSGKPLVEAHVDPDAVRDLTPHIDERLTRGPLPVIIVDPHFADVLRSMAAGTVAHPDRIRFVLAEDRAAVAALDPTESVVITRAARERLSRLIPPVFLLHAPVFAPDTVRALCRVLVQLGSSAGPGA